MSDAASTYERLAAPFALDEHAKVNKGGYDQTYAPWTAYVERMTDVLGAGNWSNRIIREGFTETECWVLVEVEAVIDGQLVVRQQYGSEPIAKGRDAKPTTDLLKSTASDALKKAISLFGPGLYLSVKEERLLIEAAMKDAIKAAAQQQRGNPQQRQQPPASTTAAGPGSQASRSASTPTAPSARPTSSSTAATPAPPTPEVDAAAQLTGAPPQPIGYLCTECHGLVKKGTDVTIPKKKGGPMVTVPVEDFAPVVTDRLKSFHCPGCYEKKWFSAA